ncbi:MAG: GNAT family N-acetyltransferase [Burkholderiales bacterium]|nr:MAG: GNAT family N-acetyltransferase [Burkholderiales bacterium]TAG78501.1 MAG: GNAT family N-acetyltransferase [Betaproteobacteria bacterium]
MCDADIETSRLRCRALADSLIETFLDYSLRNSAHFAPWEPRLGSEFFLPQNFRNWCQKQIESIANKQSLRFIVSLRDAPDRMVASINYSMIAPLPALSCNLGYSIDESLQGHGLITEALASTNAYVFDTLRLHRIAANYMPRNERSAAVLRKLGFVIEGHARDYLRIADRWEDHVLTALINENWVPQRTLETSR